MNSSTDATDNSNNDDNKSTNKLIEIEKLLEGGLKKPIIATNHINNINHINHINNNHIQRRVGGMQPRRGLLPPLPIVALTEREQMIQAVERYTVARDAARAAGGFGGIVNAVGLVVPPAVAPVVLAPERNVNNNKRQRR